MSIGLVVRFKRVGEYNLVNTTAEVPKPFMKEVSNEGNPFTTSLANTRGVVVPLLEPDPYAQIASYAA